MRSGAAPVLAKKLGDSPANFSINQGVLATLQERCKSSAGAQAVSASCGESKVRHCLEEQFILAKYK
jgi:hypothetical protein